MQNKSKINPTTGLPMVSGDICGVDVGGAPYGFVNPWFSSAQQWDFGC